MKILVLGGTRFLGRALVLAALGRGHDVTVLNRGITAPGQFPGVPRLVADRTGDLAVLAGGRWDAVIDVAGYDPDVVCRSAQALAGAVGTYVFISTVSVYVDHSGVHREDEPVLELAEDLDSADLDPGTAYGARKAAAERVVTRLHPEHLIVRPGMIVGPGDGTDRFAYWPRRIARGGRVLAPGDPADPVQVIDVRDLATFVVHAVERGRVGVFNATGETLSMGALLEACVQAVPAAQASLAWVSTPRLLAAGVDMWMGVPMWIAAPGWEGANRVDTTRARSAGLVTRPLVATLRDTLAWDRARGGPEAGREGLTRERERELLDLASQPC